MSGWVVQVRPHIGAEPTSISVLSDRLSAEMFVEREVDGQDAEIIDLDDLDGIHTRVVTPMLVVDMYEVVGDDDEKSGDDDVEAT